MLQPLCSLLLPGEAVVVSLYITVTYSKVFAKFHYKVSQMYTTTSRMCTQVLFGVFSLWWLFNYIQHVGLKLILIFSQLYWQLFYFLGGDSLKMFWPIMTTTNCLYCLVKNAFAVHRCWTHISSYNTGRGGGRTETYGRPPTECLPFDLWVISNSLLSGNKN